MLSQRLAEEIATNIFPHSASCSRGVIPLPLADACPALPSQTAAEMTKEVEKSLRDAGMI
jgi:hypothetical protein